MSKETLTTIIILALCLLGSLVGFFLFRSAKKATAGLAKAEIPKKQKRKKTFGLLLFVVGLWLFTVRLLPLLFGTQEKEGFHVAISPDRMNVFGLDVSSTIVITWIAMAIIVFLAILIRIFLVPRLKETPRGLQNVLETMTEGIGNYAGSKVHGLGDNLNAYLFSIAILLVVSAGVELFGLRAPTSDLTMTFALAFITFILINYYGIKKKGVGGRIKSLADPTPVVLPIRVVSDIAIPVSMACRLFGNMLGGMIVMELLYSALGGSAIGIPSVIGLYFNVFHPLIQAFIFITLTLTFIGEAAEEAE